MRELSLQNCRIGRRYDVLESLGRGSYAEIFVARDTLASPKAIHSRVVIKALNVFLQDDLDVDLERTLVENFQNEAVALDRVRHPNVISRMGHGTARDLNGVVFHYLVLEYMEGGDLQKACRPRPCSLKQTLHYIEQVCAGLRHAHNNGIIHRDIKPQNLLLSKDRDVVKIADFGVARLSLDDAPITRVGTNIYAPPEHSPMIQNAGHSSKLTPAADIYSLAKTFYTLCSGESPRFCTGQPITTLPMNIAQEEWAKDLERVLNKATLDDPTERHQNIEEFWKDLEPLRRFAADFETATTIRPKLHTTPQASVARGYSPMAPQKPRFNTSRELKLERTFLPAHSPLQIDVDKVPVEPSILPKGVRQADDNWPERIQAQQKNVPNTIINEDLEQARAKGRKKFRRWAAFATVVILFVMGLYSAAAYLQRSGIINSPFVSVPARTGRANTDINLRPTPSADNEPIGLVTKNSKVRILKMQNNWYQVDILEQGRERNVPLSSERGWLNSRYVDLD